MNKLIKDYIIMSLNKIIISYLNLGQTLFYGSVISPIK